MDDKIRTIDREKLKANPERQDDFELIVAKHEWGLSRAGSRWRPTGGAFFLPNQPVAEG